MTGLMYISAVMQASKHRYACCSIESSTNFVLSGIQTDSIWNCKYSREKCKLSNGGWWLKRRCIWPVSHRAQTCRRAFADIQLLPIEQQTPIEHQFFLEYFLSTFPDLFEFCFPFKNETIYECTVRTVGTQLRLSYWPLKDKWLVKSPYMAKACFLTAACRL